MKTQSKAATSKPTLEKLRSVLADIYVNLQQAQSILAMRRLGLLQEKRRHKRLLALEDGIERWEINVDQLIKQEKEAEIALKTSCVDEWKQIVNPESNMMLNKLITVSGRNKVLNWDKGLAVQLIIENIQKDPQNLGWLGMLIEPDKKGFIKLKTDPDAVETGVKRIIIPDSVLEVRKVWGASIKNKDVELMSNASANLKLIEEDSQEFPYEAEQPSGITGELSLEDGLEILESNPLDLPESEQRDPLDNIAHMTPIDDGNDAPNLPEMQTPTPF